MQRDGIQECRLRRVGRMVLDEDFDLGHSATFSLHGGDLACFWSR